MTSTYGAQLRARRLALGLTQARLSKAIGVPPLTISRWERGENRPANAGLLERCLLALEAANAVQELVLQPGRGSGLTDDEWLASIRENPQQLSGRMSIPGCSHSGRRMSWLEGQQMRHACWDCGTILANATREPYHSVKKEE